MKAFKTTSTALAAIMTPYALGMRLTSTQNVAEIAADNVIEEFDTTLHGMHDIETNIPNDAINLFAQL